MRDDTTESESEAFPFGRLIFGLGMALQASEDVRDMDDTIDYAESAGVPDPDDRDGERLAFFGNLAMFGAAVAFLREAYSGD